MVGFFFFYKYTYKIGSSYSDDSISSRMKIMVERLSNFSNGDGFFFTDIHLAPQMYFLYLAAIEATQIAKSQNSSIEFSPPLQFIGKYKF